MLTATQRFGVAGGTFAIAIVIAYGKLYRRQDEIDTPCCITVDLESLEDGAATIRDRDTMTQERVALDLVTGRIADIVACRATWAGVPRETASA